MSFKDIERLVNDLPPLKQLDKTKLKPRLNNYELAWDATLSDNDIAF